MMFTLYFLVMNKVPAGVKESGYSKGQSEVKFVKNNGNKNIAVSFFLCGLLEEELRQL